MFGHKKEKKTDRPLAAPGGDKLGVYIHIPFCKSKCDYCDFYSLAGREDQMDRYQKALLSHLAETAPMAQVPVDTIYFGGGTPSRYGEKRLKEILTALKKQLPVDKDAEITLEANPDSVDLRSLRRLRRAGFNRISLGMQSADPAELEAVHRPHTVQQTDQAVTMAKKAGFKNLSLDLIYGLPGQTEESWRATVEHALSLIPQHLSCYGLKVEEGTPLAQRVEEGEVLPDDDAQADRYLWTVGRLARAGFAQYEISNFAKPGHESRHNLRYWLTRPYIGFGPGAHSDFGGRRYSFVRDLDAYIKGVLEGGNILDSEELIPRQERSISCSACAPPWASRSGSIAGTISWTLPPWSGGWRSFRPRAGRRRRRRAAGALPPRAFWCLTSSSATCWTGRSRPSCLTCWCGPGPVTPAAGSRRADRAT